MLVLSQRFPSQVDSSTDSLGSHVSADNWS